MPSFSEQLLQQPSPESVRDFSVPAQSDYYPSPTNWRNEVLYFFLPDRFSDGREGQRKLLDRDRLEKFRPAGFRLEDWQRSGSERFQGGTLQGATGRLDYLKRLGVTCVWVGPVFKQRDRQNSYHGYAIQDFLEVDPRFGTRQDLVEFVSQAHQRKMRVILDIVFNHTGRNWVYAEGDDPPYREWPACYAFGSGLNARDQKDERIRTRHDGVWPKEFQQGDYYTKAGSGGGERNDFEDDHAVFRRMDFPGGLRDINFDGTLAVEDLIRCYSYWIALTDCDGFRLDTLKHVDVATGRRFCQGIHQNAEQLGKERFLLVGEVAGGEELAGRYLQLLGTDLDAVLDIGETRTSLEEVAKGLAPASDYFEQVASWKETLGPVSRSGSRHVSILDDHDHVAGAIPKLRFAADAASPHQVAAGVAIQLLTLGIPCIYYGTEQAMAGPPGLRQLLGPDDRNDAYLREAMFGPLRSRPNAWDGQDDLLGFGPFGTCGAHVFDENHEVYRRIQHVIGVRQKYPALRFGEQYPRPISNFGAPYGESQAGELIAWSRILAHHEILCVVNGNGSEARGADILVDFTLNRDGQFTVVGNSLQAVAGDSYEGTHPLGSKLAVTTLHSALCLQIRDLQPSEVLILSNHHA